MTSTHSRLRVVSGVFVVGLVVVLIHLWFLMVQDHEVWARRSYKNRSAFRSVPSQRGRLIDRYGRDLAYDVPTTRASINYHRFRVYHVVGAAVHGASHWANLHSDTAGTAYTFHDGILGPRAAVRDLLSVSVRALRPGALDKKDFSQLVTYATTVLSVCSGLPRRTCYAAMRDASQDAVNIGIGDVLFMTRAELLASFEDRLNDLHQLNELFQEEQQKYNERLGRTTVDRTLLESLERLRRWSLEKKRLTWTRVSAVDGEEEIVQGSLLEDVRRYFAHDVDFELAAALRVDYTAHPGIGVEPAIRRVRLGGRDSSLGILIGEVRANDRLIKKPAPSAAGTNANPSQIVADSRLPEEWLLELVPEDVAESDEALDQMRREADRRYNRELLVNERSGISGMEALCNEDLTGSLGMRFVEHDSRRREHRLWSHLRVESGNDVPLTIDIDLQSVAEDVVRWSDTRYRGGYESARDLAGLESALAIVDANTGDILALAGAPIRGGVVRSVPGLRWRGNGSIGSVMKPFVLLEHLESQRLGRDACSVAEMKECLGYFKYGRRQVKLNCDGYHGQRGRNPESALAESCNSFFYQAGLGIGSDGVTRALQRFGLSEPNPGEEFYQCWQPRVRGLPIAVPRIDTNIRLAQRSIGYGVQVAPLYVARAYAAIATGVLSEVGFRLGDRRRQVVLGDLAESLDVVRRGMADCVTRGTARKLNFRTGLQIHAKTGTAEISSSKQNNGWFAGYVPWIGNGGMQLAFCAVVYRIPSGVHGGEAAGGMIEELLNQLDRDSLLRQRYLIPEVGK